MNRYSVAKSLIGAAALVGMSSVAQAQTAPQTLNATAAIEAVVQLNVIDPVLECGTIVVSAPTACGANQGTAEVEVVANSDWTLSVDDLGGAAPGASDGEVSLFADIGRNGQFVLDFDLSAIAGASTGGDSITISPVAIRGTGGPAEQFENTDDYGSYVGEFVVTVTGS